jgi:hypothetical protein
VRPSPPTAAIRLNDVYRFSAAANTWTALSPSGSGPSRRYAMGFAATPDGMLYVFGGEDSNGTGGKRCGNDWAAWGWLRWTQSCGVHALHRCCSRCLLRRGRGWGGKRHARVRVCLRRAGNPHLYINEWRERKWGYMISRERGWKKNEFMSCIYLRILCI